MPLGEKQLVDAMIPNRSVKNVDISKNGLMDGFRFEIGNPVYRGVPFSCVEDVKLVVDNEEIPKNKISFLVRGQRINAEDAPTLHEIWWRQGEIISLQAKKDGGLAHGEHEVNIKLVIRYAQPYGIHDFEQRLHAAVTVRMMVGGAGYGKL